MNMIDIWLYWAFFTKLLVQEEQHCGRDPRGAGAESGHGGAARTKHYEMTAVSIPHSPVLLRRRRQNRMSEGKVFF